MATRGVRAGWVRRPQHGGRAGRVGRGRAAAGAGRRKRRRAASALLIGCDRSSEAGDLQLALRRPRHRRLRGRFDPYDPPSRAARGRGGRGGASRAPGMLTRSTSAWRQIDRKVGVRSYAGGVAIVIALGRRDHRGRPGARRPRRRRDEGRTAGAQDGASRRRRRRRTRRTGGSVESLSDQVDAISGSIDELQGAESPRRIRRSMRIQGDIDDLKGQISDLGSSQDSSGVSGGVGRRARGGSAMKLARRPRWQLAPKWRSCPYCTI